MHDTASGCQANDPQLADWAFGPGKLRRTGCSNSIVFRRSAVPGFAYFGRPPNRGFTGRRARVLVDGKPGAEVYVLPAPLPQNGDQLLRDAIVYLTCLHETGHALGLSHTAVFDDIMYSFQYGGDIPEYFGRYRRKLQSRDDIRKNSGMSDARPEALFGSRVIWQART